MSRTRADKRPENAAAVKPQPGPPSRQPRPTSDWLRSTARWMFHSHLWLGVLATGILLLVAVTGILLNHKSPFGLMPDVAHESSGPLDSSLPLGELARRAAAAAPPAAAEAGISRMDVRPGDGIIKVRFDDRAVSEVTIDLVTGSVLHVGERNDVFIEKLHSGEIFGDSWVLLSDAAAIILILLLASGYWLWLYPRRRL